MLRRHRPVNTEVLYKNFVFISLGSLFSSFVPFILRAVGDKPLDFKEEEKDFRSIIITVLSSSWIAPLHRL